MNAPMIPRSMKYSTHIFTAHPIICAVRTFLKCATLIICIALLALMIESLTACYTAQAMIDADARVKMATQESEWRQALAAALMAPR